MAGNHQENLVSPTGGCGRQRSKVVRFTMVEDPPLSPVTEDVVVPESPGPSNSQNQPSQSGTWGGPRPCACPCPCKAAFAPQPPPGLATTDVYRTCGLPKRFQYPSWFSGYDSGPRHPLYRTSASEVGRYAPSVHTVPTVYRPIDQSWSRLYGAAGPWRNHSLCTTGSIWDYDY